MVKVRVWARVTVRLQLKFRLGLGTFIELLIDLSSFFFDVILNLLIVLVWLEDIFHNIKLDSKSTCSNT
jgi:hypothetical protein